MNKFEVEEITSDITKEEITSISKPRKSSSNRYTKEQLINHLRKFAEENKRIPKSRDFTNNDKYPHYCTIQKTFGSWNNGLIAAGLETEHVYTKEELIEYLRKFKKENGRSPMLK